LGFFVDFYKQLCYTSIVKLNAKQKKVLLKCAEELNELSTVLLQEVNKGKCKYNKIVLELGDVEARILDLKEVLKIELNYPNYNSKKLQLGEPANFPY